MIYHDKWTYFDAWDIDIDYRKRPSEVLKPSSVDVFVDGPRAAAQPLSARHVGSVITQDAVLTAGCRASASRPTRTGTRPGGCCGPSSCRRLGRTRSPATSSTGTWPARWTRDETPQERAQFEICAHQFVDMSDADGGLALLNDGKYGHRVKAEGVIVARPAALADVPDRTADRRVHEFTYALYPHAEAWSTPTSRRSPPT